MVNKRLFLFLSLFAILSLNFISAYDVVVQVNSVPNFTVNAFFIDTREDVFSTVAVINEETGRDGIAIMNFTTNKNEFEVKLNLRKDGETFYSKEYNETFSSSSGLIELDFYPKWYQPKNSTVATSANISETNTTTEITEAESNETENETLLIVPLESNIKNKTSDKVTVFSIFDSEGRLTNTFFYYIGGIIVLAALIIIFFKYRKYRKNNPSEPKQIRTIKLSELQQQQRSQENDSETKIRAQEQRINQARNMIKEAEDELKRMRQPNADKIEAAKRKLIEDEKELMRLRRESRGY